MNDSLLVVFARAPVPGEVKTRLIPATGALRAAALHVAFVDDVCRLSRGAATRRTLALAGRRDDPQLGALATREGMAIEAQSEGDLGARMARAIEAGLAGGAAKVCILGSDSPHLPPSYLHRAFAALDYVEVVVGPAEDGGYWLIGARRAVPTLFEAMPWGTGQVLGETMARLSRLELRHAVVDRFWDVDEPADLERLRWLLGQDRSPELAPATRALLAPPLG